MTLALSVADAVKLVGVLIGTLPFAGEVGVRGALSDSIMEWPGTDWAAVAVRLRDPEQGAERIADWLDEEHATERLRISRLSEPHVR